MKSFGLLASWMRENSLVFVQGTIALFLLAALQLLPPDRGPMILVPLTGEAANSLSTLAMRGDARLLDTGSLVGTVTVSGERPDILHYLLEEGVLVISAKPRLCGQ